MSEITFEEGKIMRWYRNLLILGLGLLLIITSCRTTIRYKTERIYLHKIPQRPADAISGSQFVEQIKDLPLEERERLIFEEIIKGNIPEFLRKFREIQVTSKGKDDLIHTFRYYVMPDYLAIGSNEDFVRMPMTPKTAQNIANAFGCMLPTRKMVHDIHIRAEVKLEPYPLTENRESVIAFYEHNKIIEQQRQGKPLGALVSGVKKDVVITNRLKEKPNRVAIYGWYRPDGSRIQPLSIIHSDTYVDYSHGIRLVSNVVFFDNQLKSLADVLKDPEFCAFVSDENVITVTEYK